jgi:DNA-binding MarR family transcriptional regulator
MIEDQLKKIGLSDKEVSVYLCILQHQKILPSRVAALTAINRPTVYSVSKELAKKGLIAEDIAGSAKYLVALGEESLNNLAKQEENKLTELKHQLPEVINALREMPKGGKYSIPRIRFIDEPQLRDFLKQESPIWAKSALAGDKAWWGFQDDTLLEHYQDWADYFWTTFPSTIKLNLFTNKKEIETKVMARKTYSDQRHIKYLENNAEFTATHVVVGDYILFIMTHERPHYLIEIYDRVMAENTRQVFKRLWDAT